MQTSAGTCCSDCIKIASVSIVDLVLKFLR
jgi:hypothetical protein